MMRLPGGVLAAFGSLAESEYLPFLTDAERFFASVMDEDGERAEAVRYLIEVAAFIDQIICEGRYHFHESDYMLLDRKQFVDAIATIRELFIDAEFEPSLAGIETFGGERTLSSVQDEFLIFIDALERMIPTFDRVTLQQWLRYWDASRIETSDDDAPVIIRADDLPEQVQLQVPEEFGLHAVFDDAGRLIRLEHYENGVPSQEYLDVNPDLQAAYEINGIEKEEGKDPSVSPADYAVYYYDWIWDRIERFCKRYESQLLECSFCTKTQAEVLKLIAGPSVYICNECVGLCNDILSEELEATQEN